MFKKRITFVVIVIAMLSTLLAGCAVPEPEVVEVFNTVEVEVVKEVEKLITPTAEPEKQAKYVFLFIGDGMAVSQRNAAELYLAETSGVERPEDAQLVINTFPAQGMNTTYDLTSVIPDSASTATALASGHKTASGVIGIGPDGKEVFPNISEAAKNAGWKVGVISSVSIDHATPAAFYAHQASRNDYYEISRQLAESDYDYFAGGGVKYPAGKDKDKDDVLELAAANGFTVVTDKAAFDALEAGAGKVWAMNPDLQDSKAMHYELDRSDDVLSLSDFVVKGIELLDNETGFFMAVESGKIDWACHANDAAASIHDTLAFDAAVAEAVKFYEQHPDETLIVVTGDHETGGMTIGFAGTGYNNYINLIENQKMSYVAFEAVLNAYKESAPASPKLEDLKEDIEAAFGLKMLSAEEMEDLSAKAEGGDEEAAAVLAMALSDLEMTTLQNAFAETMLDQEERSSDQHTYLLYGGYEPLIVKLTTILNQKAGIAWTSYSHTGVPVQTSAIGVGAENFNGYYDQVNINDWMMAITGLTY